MRLPTREVFRAFPELDSFSDEQCRGYVRTVRRRHWLRLYGLQFAAAVLVFMLSLVLSAAAGVVIAELGSFLAPASLDLEVAAVMIVVIVPFVLPLLAIFFTRDRVLRNLLRAQITTAACGACGYSLLGLPVEDRAVICPECGERLDLERMGLRPEDLLAREIDSDALATT